MQSVARAANGRHRPTEDAGAWRAHLAAALAWVDIHAKCTAHDTLVALGGYYWHQGLAADDLQALLLEVNARLSRRNRRNDIRGIVRWLKRRPRDGTKGRHRAPADPRVTQFLADARAAIAAWPLWKGRGGKTDRAVVEAHLLIVETWQSPIHEGAERLMAPLANVKRRTLRRAHRRLMKAGWLDLLRAAFLDHGQLWRLQIPVLPVVGRDGGEGEANESAQNAPIQIGAPLGADWGFVSGLPKVGALNHSLFREGQGGLGKSVGALLVDLDTQGPVKTQTAWARRADGSTATIRRREKELLAFRLIEKVGKRGYRRGPASYDEVAAALRLDELAQRERAHYREETAEHREWLTTHQRHEREALATSMAAIERAPERPSSSPFNSEGATIYVLRRPPRGTLERRAAP
jgi:hypothetical protein